MLMLGHKHRHGEGHTEAAQAHQAAWEARPEAAEGVGGSPGQLGWEPLVTAAPAPWVPRKALSCTEVLHTKAIGFVSAWLPALVDPQEKRLSLGGDGLEVGLPWEEEATCSRRPQGETCTRSSPLTPCTGTCTLQL